jgi:hypothetical protein
MNDSSLLQPASQIPQPHLLSAAERLILKHLHSVGGQAPLKSVCLSILPANRQLLLRAIERLARRGAIQVRAGSDDLVLRVVREQEVQR